MIENVSSDIKAVIFDFGLTLCSQKYFTNQFPEYPNIHQVYQDLIFNDKDIIDQWMRGTISYFDIGKKISEHTQIDLSKILLHMENGCKKLPLNNEVYDFALEMKKAHKEIFLVTVNMDVFSLFVIPNHKELDIFSKIINSSDYKENDKNKLWPLAFENRKIDYSNTLLIEDDHKNIEKFEQNGGKAYQYTNEDDFRKWKRERIEEKT